MMTTCKGPNQLSLALTFSAIVEKPERTTALESNRRSGRAAEKTPEMPIIPYHIIEDAIGYLNVRYVVTVRFGIDAVRTYASREAASPPDCIPYLRSLVIQALYIPSSCFHQVMSSGVAFNTLPWRYHYE